MRGRADRAVPRRDGRPERARARTEDVTLVPRVVRAVVAEYPEFELEAVRECLRYAAWLMSGRRVDVPLAA